MLLRHIFAALPPVLLLAAHAYRRLSTSPAVSEDAAQIDAPLAAVAVAVKTCGAFHETRLRAWMHAWGKRAPMRVFATDTLLPTQLAIRSNETVVMPDFVAYRKHSKSSSSQEANQEAFWSWHAEEGIHFTQAELGEAEAHHFGWQDEAIFVGEAPSTARSVPYVPGWRLETDEEMRRREDVPPALTRRVARALEVLYDRFAEDAEWFLIVDDDTFVRFDALRATLARLNASQPMMLGFPYDTYGHLTAESATPSVHCHGAAWMMSRAALALLRPRLEECLRSRAVRLGWYYDEVVLGRCLHAFAGLNCHPLRGVINLDRRQGGVAKAPVDVPVGPDSRAQTIFATMRPDETKVVETFVAVTPADHEDLLTQHPALPEDMQRLRRKFTRAADAAWIQRLMRGEVGQPESWLSWVAATPARTCVAAAVLWWAAGLTQM